MKIILILLAILSSGCAVPFAVKDAPKRRVDISLSYSSSEYEGSDFYSLFNGRGALTTSADFDVESYSKFVGDSLEADMQGVAFHGQVRVLPWLALGLGSTFESGTITIFGLDFDATMVMIKPKARVYPLGSLEIFFQPFASVGGSLGFGSIENEKFNGTGSSFSVGLDVEVPSHHHNKKFHSSPILRIEFEKTKWGGDLDGIDQESLTVGLGIQF